MKKEQVLTEGENAMENKYQEIDIESLTGYTREELITEIEILNSRIDSSTGWISEATGGLNEFATPGDIENAYEILDYNMRLCNLWKSLIGY